MKQLICSSIKFWECSSQYNWLLHKAVNNETKLFKLIPQYLYKLSWDFSKKNKYDEILSLWKMIFQALDLKGWQFLDLYDKDNNLLEPSYARGGV